LVNIASLISLGAVVVVGILIFTQFQKLGGFLGALKFPEIKLPDFNIDLSGLSEPAFEPGTSPISTGEVVTPPNIIGEDTSGGFGTRDRPGQGGLIGPTQDLFGGIPRTLDQFIGLFTGGGTPGFGRDDPRREGVIEAAPANTITPGLTDKEDFDFDVTSPFPQQFGGGGPSFIGGQVFQTPIQNLSLSQIIDRFGVTASQAANIRAIAADDFGDFDFGTNTGGGIGSIIPSISSLLPSGGAVSDPLFSGLSAEEIALRLTGGNISNF